MLYFRLLVIDFSNNQIKLWKSNDERILDEWKRVLIYLLHSIGYSITLLKCLDIEGIKYMSLIEGTTHIVVIMNNTMNIYDFITGNKVFEQKHLVS